MSDPRFAKLKTDPRFRRIRNKESKVVVDERFKSVFGEEEGGKKKKKGKGKGRVDKYGRPLSDTHEQDNLRRFYRLEHEEDEKPQDTAATSVPDYARGAVLLESSDEEDDADKKDDDEDNTEGFVTLGRDISRPISLVANEDEEPEIDLDEDNFADLDAQAAAYAKEHEEDDSVPEANRTSRIAVVNLDWDHVRAIHLYKVFSSLVSPTAPAAPSTSGKSTTGKKSQNVAPRIVRGKVLSVRVYRSDFGKERLAREEEEGPPTEVFKANDSDDDERGLHETGNGEDYNEDALRKYQLERLRYYYAIVQCDSVETASHLYDELEGTEFERSANVFDLSFVPEDMKFDDDFRDEATGDLNVPYKGLEFVTAALRHSKVKLTWDEDDPERAQLTRRTLSRKEIDENDFKAYLASSSESEPEEDSSLPTKGKNRDRLRALLLSGGDDALPEGWGKNDPDEGGDTDMEITFTPGLSASNGKGDGEETTLEKYQRKMKEKKKRRKEELKEQSHEQRADDKRKGKKGMDDDFFAAEEDSVSEDAGAINEEEGDVPSTKKTQSTAEELSLIAASDNPNGEAKHFSMKAVLKAEKSKGKKRKGKKGRGGEDEKEVQEDFSIDVADDRFKALHEDHTFAIDPSNPHFKKTKSMSALLEERTKRRRQKQPKADAAGQTSNTASASQTDLKSLVESVKRKSVGVDGGIGKRRKV